MNATIASAKAGSHPLRLRILEEMRGRSTSPNRLSAKLDEPLGNVSYHVKTLLEYDCIQQDKTEPRRGAVEHYYSVTPAGERLLRSTNGEDDSEVLDKIAETFCSAGGHHPNVLERIMSLVAATGRDVG